MIRARVGSAPGRSFAIRVVGGEARRIADVEIGDLRARVVDLEVSTFSQIAVKFTGRGWARLFVLEPATQMARYDHDLFFIEGPFSILAKMNNVRDVDEQWRAFRGAI